MRTIKAIAILLILALSGQCLARELGQSELWSGRVDLSEDVVVPTGLSLTLAPGTQVTTHGHRIISYGTVNILGEPENSVEFSHFAATPGATLEVIKIKPYDVDTQILKEEFDSFKVQYAILWSLLFASTFLMLEAR